eukprot:2772300-Prymnesium_polylepis.1
MLAALTALLAPTSGFVLQTARSTSLTRAVQRSTTLELRHGEGEAAAVAALAAAIIAGSAGQANAAPPAFREQTSALLALQTTDWTAAEYDWSQVGKPKPPPAPPPPPPAPVV